MPRFSDAMMLPMKIASGRLDVTSVLGVRVRVMAKREL